MRLLVDLYFASLNTFTSVTQYDTTMLQQYLHETEQARVALLALYQSIPDNNNAPEGRWSAREILYHLYKTELGIAKIYRAGARAATMHIAKTDEELTSEHNGLQEVVERRDVKIIAPDHIQPSDLPPDIDVVELLAQSRSMLLQYIALRTDDDLRSMSFAHPVRGLLTLYGWITFVGVHEQRHTEQMSELLTS